MIDSQKANSYYLFPLTMHSNISATNCPRQNRIIEYCSIKTIVLNPQFPSSTLSRFLCLTIVITIKVIKITNQIPDIPLFPKNPPRQSYPK